MTERPACSCHGEPMYWHKKKDMRAGGLWRCRVRKREVERLIGKRRYDADPVYRITKRLRDDAGQRRRRLDAARERLRREHGPL